MEKYDVYKDVSERTNGEIYIGVVGGVRTGKSTFIGNFMNKLVLPFIKSKHERERMTDELPQSAQGKSVMTTQPKFVPAEAAEITLADNIRMKIRLVDCVGYMVEGAIGHEEDGKPRLVLTPWSDTPVTFERAAEIGTRKVIEDHSTIGVVMTSDGSIDTELPRSAYVSAEERAVHELTELGKPFVVILNSKVPESKETVKLARALSDNYKATVLPMDVLNMTEEDIISVFKDVLLEFPLRNVHFKLDRWLRALPVGDSIIAALSERIASRCASMNKMRDYTLIGDMLDDSDDFVDVSMSDMKLGCGEIEYEITADPKLFYKALSNSCGMDIDDDFALMREMKGLVYAKKQFDKLSSALEDVKRTGYGIVEPSLDEMTLLEPEIVKQGSHYGVKLKANAQSLHIMQVEVSAEVSPVMGAEQQSEEMVKNMLAGFEGNPKGIWETDMFGKSMHVLVNEGLSGKIRSMPEDTQKKMRKTVSRIINEGKGGVICILL